MYWLALVETTLSGRYSATSRSYWVSCRWNMSISLWGWPHMRRGAQASREIADLLHCILNSMSLHL